MLNDDQYHKVSLNQTNEDHKNMTVQEKLDIEYPDSNYITTELSVTTPTTYSWNHNPHLMPKTSLKLNYMRAQKMLMFAKKNPTVCINHISSWESIIKYVHDKYPELLI